MFQIQCSNKGCREYQQPALDTNEKSDTFNEVLCSKCGKPIENVSQFHKTAMKGIGQIKRDDNRKQAFAVTCPKCRIGDRPVITKHDEILCKHFGTDHTHLSKPYAQALRSTLRPDK